MPRPYTSDDLAAVQRIWKECGWIEDENDAKTLEPLFSEGTVVVGEVNGEVECSVSTHRGHYSYDGQDLDLLVVSSVTTSWIGRKLGLAQQLTAEAVVAGAEEGAHMAILGMFEQGFYNRLGFGSGPYEHTIRFDPASIRVDTKFRTPVRLTADNYLEISEAMRRRKRTHGATTITSAEFVRAELLSATPPFGLGYRDDQGKLTHFIFGKAKGESGPFAIWLTAYETVDQLLELFAMLRGLGDQVRGIVMLEPAEVQVQDLLMNPIRGRIVTKGTDYESGTRALAWWQARILDLPMAVSKRRWAGPPVRFNLDVRDPLDDVYTGEWDRTSGSYVVEIGEVSSAVRSEEAEIPTLRASINAFSRMWIGAMSATSLSYTDELEGPSELLDALDDALHLPTPRPGMYF